MTSRTLIAAIGLALLFVAVPDEARGVTPPPGGWSPDNGINLGVGLAWVGGGEMGNAFSPCFDITFAQKINRPLYVWISAGAKSWIGKDSTGLMPYVETGLSFLVFNLGAGYGPGLLSDEMPRHSVNGFFGISIPTWAPRKGRLFYLEPYYRPTWDVSGDDGPVAHEVGVLFQWYFMTSPRAE